MKTIFLSLFTTLFCITLIAGDTTSVRIHDHTDMTWYGNYDEWGELPDASKDYRKVYLNYTMGCATGGCSDWDYTSQIFVRHRTGEIDSTLNTTPNFTINGNSLDTAYFTLNPIFTYSWNNISNYLDSTTTDTLIILQFNDINNPTIATDTLIAFASNINVYSYDTIGNITDTTFIAADSIWFLENYMWHSTFEVIENYELARVITPYGSGLANNWEFTSTFDITDFIQILRDSVEIRCHYSGWSSGFSATLDFEFIEGTPPRNVMKIENVYSGTYNYINTIDFESTKLTEKIIEPLPFNGGGKLRVTATGHGFDNNQSAAEFKPIDYYVKQNGLTLYTQYNWDSNCGENPIYPQGGTWIYDRANWCPGTRAQTFEHEIESTISFGGSSMAIDIDFQEYTWNGTQTPSYIIETQFVQYMSPNFTNSAEIIDIIKPSLKDEYSRKNPICGKPLIKIKNYGENPLVSLDIDYKIVGGSNHTFNWTGNLDFMQTEEVELPNLTNWSGSTNIFEVTLKNPNGQSDDYDENNIMQSEFEYVPEYPETFALWIGTNGGVINTFTQESETTWDFLNENGNIEFTSGSLYGNTQYRDTLTFSPGCYTFVVNDSDEDGLDFWANNDGSGMARFREIGASWLKSFNADFGTNIIHQFTVGSAQTTTSFEQNITWEIYPNPTKNTLMIEGVSDGNTKIILQNNIGKIILERTVSKSGFNSETINLEQFENGVYLIKISNSTEEIIKKVVKI